MDKRIEIHNNYISAIDLVNRLKKSRPHNAAHYQAELEQLLVCNDDVIDWILPIMKTAGSTNAPDGHLCFRCKQPGHLKAVQNNPTALSAEQEATSQQSVL